MQKYKIPLALTFVVITGAFLFFSNLYHRDIGLLENFVASYEKFDTAISDFSTRRTNDSENNANGALIELKARATFRASSLIKNDRLIPPLVFEIADLSGKELDALAAYKKGSQGTTADLETLAEEYKNLTRERKAAYARFRGLAE